MKPLALVILDGFGHRKQSKNNAILAAKMETWILWLKTYPNTLLDASGKAVGLPEGFMGNSEVGHLTIGSGREVKSVLTKINESISNNLLSKNENLINNLKTITEHNSLHILGLMSDAGVHSHIKHILELINIAKQQGIQNIYLHAFTDGRDTSKQSATKFLQSLGDMKIASIHGRFYAMDRDNNWDRTQLSYKALTEPDKVKKWKEALGEAYDNNETDEFVSPKSLIPNGIIKDGDGVIFANFRSDRARQITECFINDNFKSFPRKVFPQVKFFISMTQYKKDFENTYLFEEEKIPNTLIETLLKEDKKILCIAETEKYAHVTYFFKGMIEKRTPNEEWILVPSIKAKNYVQQPEMSAAKITETVINAFENNPKDFYLINYANADMVGHSGNLEATTKACKCLDQQLKILFEEFVVKQNGILIVTSDHGNAEDVKGHHTTNPVTFLILDNDLAGKSLIPNRYGLANIAPTILNLMKIAIPKEMAIPIKV